MGQYIQLSDGSHAVQTSLTGSNAKEPFSGSTTTTKTFSKSMRGFVITNDGVADLTFTIGTDTFTVKQGETFAEPFDPFTQVTVTTNQPFRAWGRG